VNVWSEKMVSGINGGFASPSDWSQLAPNAGRAQPPSDADIRKRMSSAEDRMSRELFGNGNGDYQKDLARVDPESRKAIGGYVPLSEGGMINY
jgi:hypothetical protein